MVETPFLLKLIVVITSFIYIGWFHNRLLFSQDIREFWNRYVGDISGMDIINAIVSLFSFGIVYLLCWGCIIAFVNQTTSYLLGIDPQFILRIAK